MTIALQLPVNKKIVAATFLLAFLFLAAVVLQSVSLVSANPVPYPPEPNTDLPTLTVQTPPNYSESYAAKGFSLNFTVTKPDSWNSYWMGRTNGLPVIGVYVVLVYLDDVRNCSYHDPCIRDVPTTSYSLVLDGLTSEPHTLKIDLMASALYNNSNYANKQAEKYNSYQSNITQTIHFTLDADSKTLLFTADPQVITRAPYPSPYDPSSQSPSPLPSPSPSSSPVLSFQETENQPEPQPFPTLLVAASVASVAVAGVCLVVYFGKVKKGKAE